MRYLLSFICPPAAVLVYGRRRQLLLNVLLTLCFWIPGSIHALFPAWVAIFALPKHVE